MGLETDFRNAPALQRLQLESRSGLFFLLLKWHNITVKIINIEIVSIHSSNEISLIAVITVTSRLDTQTSLMGHFPLY